MMNLNLLFKQPLSAVKKSTTVFLLVVALVGFADATYLTVEHYRGVIPPCSITAGCEQVLTSPYASVLGLPVSLLGAIFYLAIALGVFIYLESEHSSALKSRHFEILKWTLLLTILGFAASLWFVFVQVFIIHSYCAYCLGSALTSTILFVIAMEILRSNQRNSKFQAPSSK